jgi:hypothetical protein
MSEELDLDNLTKVDFIEMAKLFYQIAFNAMLIDLINKQMDNEQEFIFLAFNKNP